MILAVILGVAGMWLLWGAYRIKFRGRVDLIAGVNDANALADAKALANWVGNKFIVAAGIMLCGALLVLTVPRRYILVVLLLVAVGGAATAIAAATGAQSRGRTRSH